MLKIAKHIGYVLGFVLGVITFLTAVTVSWLFVCGIIKVITMLLGWAFSFVWATFIWGVLIFIWAAWPKKKEGEKHD